MCHQLCKRVVHPGDNLESDCDEILTFDDVLEAREYPRDFSCEFVAVLDTWCLTMNELRRNINTWTILRTILRTL